MPVALAEDFIEGRAAAPDRRAAIAKLLADFGVWMEPRALEAADAHDLDAFLRSKIAAGSHPNTVRKWLMMARSFYGWLYEHGAISAETWLAMRTIAAPSGASREPCPSPYRPGELRALRGTLEERWPRLSAEESRRLVERWRLARSPYSRVRRHAIRLQLEAIIALALDLSLRRAEIFALSVDAMHPDNAHVLVWPDGRDWTGEPREVPFTVAARQAVADWLELRSQMGVEHDRPWVQLWSTSTAGAPMKTDTFEKLLATYVGPGWTFKRLRDTCAVRWLNAGLPLEHVRALLGLRSLESVLPYARHASGRLEVAMHRREAAFTASLAPAMP